MNALGSSMQSYLFPQRSQTKAPLQIMPLESILPRCLFFIHHLFVQNLVWILVEFFAVLSHLAPPGHGGGAESLAETIAPVSKKLRKGKHLAAADGSPALHSASKTQHVPSLKGVSHIKHLFTPLSVIPKKGLVEAEMLLLRDLVKQGCARETRMGFRVVGGDNAAEALASVTKRQLRRHGLISVTNDSIEHRNLLAVHHVNKKPGLSTVLAALKQFRELSMSSLMPASKVWDAAPWKL